MFDCSSDTENGEDPCQGLSEEDEEKINDTDIYSTVELSDGNEYITFESFDDDGDEEGEI